MKRRINEALVALTLVRVGQELGSDSQAARAIHDAIVILAALIETLSRFPK